MTKYYNLIYPHIELPTLYNQLQYLFTFTIDFIILFKKCVNIGNISQKTLDHVVS